jgi:hypothetical protein
LDVLRQRLAHLRSKVLVVPPPSQAALNVAIKLLRKQLLELEEREAKKR